MESPHHKKAVAEQCDANQMEQIEWPDNDGIRLQEFPREALHSIPRYEQVETVADDRRVAVHQRAQPEGEKQQHRSGFVELHRMPVDAVAEVYAARQLRCCPVGVIGQAREEATESADGDAQRQWTDEWQARRAADAAHPFVDFNSDHATRDRAGN